jgi:predicted AlkP superfamily phosphohydrolase/phosphomutase
MVGKKVIIFGFDSLDFELIRTWASEGHMPNFHALFERSRWGLVENPKWFESGAAWPTFTTGFSPEYHGLFQAPYRFDVGTYEFRVIRKEERVINPIWVDASNAGKRVAVVDAPYELLEDQLNGIQVTDWLVHVFTRYPGLATHPPELANEIKVRYGTNPFEGSNRCPTNDFPVDTADNIVELRDRLLDRLEWKRSLSLGLLLREPWDYFLTVFHESHDIGHMCWHIHDQNHERHDPRMAALVGNPILDVYIALDAALGSLLDAVQSDANVIVYSSHGMGPERTASRFFDEILLKLDESYGGVVDAIPEPQNLNLTTWFASVYRAIVPVPLRRQILKTAAMKRIYDHMRLERLKHRRFFELVPNHATGGVRINLKGRERYGSVEPGQEFEELCNRLRHDLTDIVNVDSGEPLIKTITKTAVLYDGPMISAMPDLLLEWNKSVPIDCVYSPRLGTLRRRSPSVRSGDHLDTKGVFFALGPGIRPGGRDAAVSAADFAPTFAALLGLHDRKYSGSPISDICKSAP